MLQCEGAEDLQRLLENHHKHKKGEPGLGRRLDITPVHMPFDSSLGTFLLAETTGGGLCCLRCDRREDCAAEALLPGKFFPESVYLFLRQRAFF